MIKVVYLIRKTSGGMQTHINGLLSELDRSKYEPFVISPKTPKLFSFLEEAGVAYYEIDMADSISPKADFVTARLVAKQLRKFRPQILHIHGNKAAMVGWLATHLWPVRRVITTVHNFPSNLDPSSKRYAITKQTNRIVFNGAKRLIAVSTELKRYLEKDIGINTRKITVIPNGIDIGKWKAYKDTGRLDAGESLGLPDDAILMGAVGRLVPFKGHKVLLKSMQQVVANHPNVYLLIMGDGPLREKLGEQAEALGISRNVRFLGFVNEPGRYMAELDLFVLPSINEPFGIVLLEAMATGLPIVSTRAGGVLDIVEDGVTGLLAEPGDEKSLAGAIEKVLDDKKLRKSLAQNGQKLVRDNFTIKAMADKTFGVYESLLG